MAKTKKNEMSEFAPITEELTLKFRVERATMIDDSDTEHTFHRAIVTRPDGSELTYPAPEPGDAVLQVINDMQTIVRSLQPALEGSVES